jgi:type IV secretion system protein TrbI
VKTTSVRIWQDRKSAFLSTARGELREKYIKSSRVRPLSKYEIKAGWDIPAVLEQSLNSDLPGEIRALVRGNVYDIASGNYLLIPQGSRLLGRYDSRIAYAQDGVTVVWDRVVFPDGSSIDLEGMDGQDAQGRAGLRWQSLSPTDRVRDSD